MDHACGDVAGMMDQGVVNAGRIAGERDGDDIGESSGGKLTDPAFEPKRTSRIGRHHL